MFAFNKFQPAFQVDTQGGGMLSDLVENVIAWRAGRRERKAPSVSRPVLTLADAGQFRHMPVLALPPPPRLAGEHVPTKRAKRRGKYGPSRSLYWILEIDGVAVNGKGGKARRFPTKAAALAYA